MEVVFVVWLGGLVVEVDVVFVGGMVGGYLFGFFDV